MTEKILRRNSTLGKGGLVKKYLIFFILFSFNLSAIDWRDYWIKALENVEIKNYAEAEKNFNLAVDEMEKEGDFKHSYVYLDRSKLFFHLEMYQEALNDLDIVLSSDYLTDNDLVQALVNRIFIRSKIGISEGILDDLERFGRVYKSIPKIENTNEKLIIRDMPNCECVKKMLNCYFIHSGLCNSKNDICMLQSNVCIVNKSHDCGCKECEDKKNQDIYCDNCGKTITGLKNLGAANTETCNSWCDANAIIASGWCGKVFKRSDCAVACLAAVYIIQKGCYWCCSEGNFYKKCIKPFESITDYMDIPCDPYWD